MKIEAYSIVSLNYVLKNADGEILDQSELNEPLIYMHGTDYLVPGLENAITGHKKGDSFSIVVKPEDGYGLYQDSLVQKLSVAVFGGNNIQLGETYVAQTEEGPRPVIVTAIENEWVTVDGNHPLAGQELYFDIEVVDVREPTPEEVSHRHVHENGHCCCHHHGEHEEHHCCHHHDDEHEEHHCCHHHDEEHEEHHCCHHHDEDHEEHHCCHHHDEDDEEHHCCHHHDDEHKEHHCCHHHDDDHEEHHCCHRHKHKDANN